MKRHFLLFVYLVFAAGVFLFSSCKKENRWDMFKGTGKRITETRPLTAFNKIYLEDNENIIITPGNYYEAKVEAGEKLIPLIHTKVDSGTLILSNDNRCNWARSYKKGIINVYVTMPTLRFIWHYGSGNITCSDTIHCHHINVQTRETGNITF